MKKHIRRARNHIRDIAIGDATPHAIGLGFAVGVFFGILPTLGFEFVFLAFASLFFKHINKVAMIGALALLNPFVMIFVYGASFQVGGLLFGSTPLIGVEFNVAESVFRASSRLMLGSLVLAAIFTPISYFVMRYLAQWYREK